MRTRPSLSLALFLSLAVLQSATRTAAAAGRTVEICPSGCEYEDLASACASVTSTSQSPVTFRVGPGRYASPDPVRCSGQDHAIFRGSGPGATVLENTSPRGYADYGAFEPGISTNYVVEGFTIIGHRSIHMEMQQQGGSEVIIRGNELRTTGLNLDEDCLFIKDPAPGTRMHLEHNRCEFKADGFTLKADPAGDLQIYAKGNHFTNVADPSFFGAWHFESAPCVFVSQDESFRLGGDRLFGGTLQTAYDFQYGSGGGCASPVQYTIIGPAARIENLDLPGETGGGKFMNIDASVTYGGQITIIGADATITTTDSSRGLAYGIYDASTTVGVSVLGGRFRTSGGGIANIDFDGHVAGSRIHLYGVDYRTQRDPEGPGANVAAGDVRRLKASVSADLGMSTVTLPRAGDGLVLFNDRAGFHDQSPHLAFRTSPGGTGSKTWRLFANASDRFNLIEPDGQIVLDWRGGGRAVDIQGSINMTNKFGEIKLGDGTVSDKTRIRWDGANDAAIAWVESARRMQITGPGVLRFPASEVRPASCDAGDMRVETDGTFCFCTSPGTPGLWLPLGAGSCND